MKNRGIALMFVCAAALCAGSAAGAQTYSFDDYSIENAYGASYVYTPSFTGVTFNAKSGVSDTSGPFLSDSPPDGGTQAAFLQATDVNGFVSLAFSGLTIGNSYAASFYLSLRNGYDAAALAVDFNGVGLGTYLATSTDFAKFTTSTFTATTTSGTLTFNSAPTTTSGDNDVNLDAVTISGATTPAGSVPEAATWAMMILGIGAVGVAMRRQKVSTQVKFA